jgi:hypothetical protein
MNSFICRCCGEPMPESGNALSRNPNISASCSSMADGMDDSPISEDVSREPGLDPTLAEMEALVQDQRENLSAEFAGHRFLK